MPDGAISHDLENISRFRDYAAANVESWYRYANGPRGRQAKNGDLRLVVGCDKSTSWGMATMSKMSQGRIDFDYLKLVSKRVNPEDAPSQLMEYSWEHSGVAEVRAGPDPAEIEEWRAGDSFLTSQYSNQCLFVRTLNLTLGPNLWEKVNRDLGLTLVADDQSNKMDTKTQSISSPARPDSSSSVSSSNTGTIREPHYIHTMEIRRDVVGNVSPPQQSVTSSLSPPPVAVRNKKAPLHLTNLG